MKKAIAILILAAAGCGGAPTRREALREHVGAKSSKRILLFFYATSGSTWQSDRARKIMRNPETLAVVRKYFELVPVDTGERRDFEIWSEDEPEETLVRYFRSKGVRNAEMVVAYRATPPLLVVTDAEGRVLAEHNFSGKRDELRQWLHLHAE